MQRSCQPWRRQDHLPLPEQSQQGSTQEVASESQLSALLHVSWRALQSFASWLTQPEQPEGKLV